MPGCRRPERLQGRFTPNMMHAITLAAALSWTHPFSIQPSRAADSYVSSSTSVTVTCGGVTVKRLERIGAGGSGTVYHSIVTTSALDALRPGDSTVLKIGNAGSNPRLENECSVLRHLSSSQVPGFERCEAICTLSDDGEKSQRSALVLTPYFSSDGPIFGSLDLLTERDHSRGSGVGAGVDTATSRAWRGLVDSCVRALAAGVASSDLQFLVDTRGRLLVLDLTEARLLRLSPPATVDPAREQEQQLALSFLGELRSNMPAVLGDDGRAYLDMAISNTLSDKPFFQFLFEEKE